MDQCVLTCSSFHFTSSCGLTSSVEARAPPYGVGRINRASIRRSCGTQSSFSTEKRTMVSRLSTTVVSVRCCTSPEGSYGVYDDGSEEAFPQLSPKPTPRPIPQKEPEIEDPDKSRSRIMSFLENFPDKAQTREEPVPDPAIDSFKTEMRRRLLYAEPEPVRDDEDEEDIEFDVFEHLVLTIRHILHMRYNVGERLESEDELILLEEAIPYHPDREFKVGCGVDHIKIDIHPEFNSRCFFIVRKDQTEIDFSYRKCMMGLAKAKPDISLDRAKDLIYFFKTTGGQKRPRFFSLV